MTQRIGLRHVSRIIPKRLVCPSGEQIVNGDFENGQTGWTFNNNAQLTTARYHSPTHSVYFPNAPYGNNDYIEQDIPNVPVVCIQSFDLYYWKLSGGLGLCYWIVTVYYTDGTNDTGFFSSLADPLNWLYYNILHQCDPTKIINKVKILAQYINGSGFVDDVSLIC